MKNDINFASECLHYYTNSLALMKQHFEFLSENLTWCLTKGVEILQKKTTTEKEWWDELFDRAFALWFNHSGIQTIDFFFTKTVWMGIKSLEANIFDLSDEEVHDWIGKIRYQLQPTTRCGVGSKTCSDDESRKMIDTLASIIVKRNHPQKMSWLKTLANDRNMHDETTKKLHIQNWLSIEESPNQSK